MKAIARAGGNGGRWMVSFNDLEFRVEKYPTTGWYVFLGGVRRAAGFKTRRDAVQWIEENF